MNMKREAATPPEHITTEEILRRMRMGVSEDYYITLREMKFPMRIISIDELTAIRREAIRLTTLASGDETDTKVHIQKTVLMLASRMQGGMQTITEKLMKFFTVDELNFLYEEYIKIMDDANPSIEKTTPEQFRALVDAVKKKAITSKDCSLHQLRAIFNAYQDLILRLEEAKQQKDNSSGGQ